MKKLDREFFNEMKKSGKCEATDCRGKSKRYFQCQLKEDFDNEECIWCEDCRDDGFDMKTEWKLIKS